MVCRFIFLLSILLSLVAGTVFGLTKSEKEVIEILSKTILDDPAPANRRVAAILLGYSANREALELLLKALDEDKSALVREAVAISLGVLKVPEVGNLVRHKIIPAFEKETDKKVCLALIEALGQIGIRSASTLLRQLAIEEWKMPTFSEEMVDFRIPAIRALGLIADRRSGAILIKDILERKEKLDDDLLITIAWALGKMKIQSMDPSQFFQSMGKGEIYDVCKFIVGDEKVVDDILVKFAGIKKGGEEIAEAVGWYRIEKARTYLEALIPPNDKGTETFIQKVVWALGELRDPLSIKPLEKALENSKSLVIQKEILTALSKIGKSESRDVIKKLIENATLKVDALYALANGGGDGIKEATPLLRDVLKTGNPKQQCEAILALGRLMDKDSLPQIEKFLESQNMELRLTAATVILLLSKE